MYKDSPVMTAYKEAVCYNSLLVFFISIIYVAGKKGKITNALLRLFLRYSALFTSLSILFDFLLGILVSNGNTSI